MYALLRYIVTGIFKILFGIKFEGKENIPKNGGVVYASNHRSYYDPVFISLPVRKRFAYMAKEELFHQNIFFTALIKIMGAFPVTRGSGDTSVIDTSIEKLRKGKNLVIFPEGTRSYDGKVGKGKTGVALIAAKSGADVIPVGICFEGSKVKRGTKVTVKFGAPISAKDLSVSENPTPRELKAVKLKIMSAITELVEGSAAESDSGREVRSEEENG